MSSDPRFAQAVEITTATYDAVARDYAERRNDMGEQWAARIEDFATALAEAAEERPIPELGRPGDDITLEEYLQFIPVLDAGCGPGRDARALAAHDLPVLGVDLSQGMRGAGAGWLRHPQAARRRPTGEQARLTPRP